MNKVQACLFAIVLGISLIAWGAFFKKIDIGRLNRLKAIIGGIIFIIAGIIGFFS